MEWLLDLGYFGLFAGSLLAATILPFSSDFLLLGMLAAGADPVLTVAVASLGNWAGGMISYGMGRSGRWEWIERWFKVRRETLERQKARIDRWGAWLAFLSWLPLVGDLFALALGFYKVSLWRVALFMLIGKTARFVGWAVAVEWIRPLFA
ncbi:MAG: DedA family protein [Rikenella sp.]|nr:DedA family protein [Rikenella sp.]